MERRQTSQRSAILTLLKDHKTHPTAAEIYTKVSKQHPHLSRTTVYRNLELLETEGLVRAVPLAGTTRYESLEDGHHDHFVCESCGHITDLHIPGLDKKALAHLKKNHPDLAATTVTISWSGTCRRCQRR